MRGSGKLQDSLTYPPRGLRASRAAAYLGMSESSFLNLVDEGKMPKAVKVKGMVIWDRLELDAAFDKLKQDEEQPRRRNTADIVLGIKTDDKDD